MAQYGTFCCTTIGYSHIRRGIRCEDYTTRLDDGDIHIAVVSDGHGDKSCFRSHVGAELAAKIAQNNLHKFALEMREQAWETRLFQPKDQERLIRQLIRSIVAEWNVQILEDLEKNPVTEEEYALAGGWADCYRNGLEQFHIYGCTLIAAMVTDRYLLVLHQGDGRCVVVHQNGTVDQPVPWDSRCQGNVSTSMCQTDTLEACRYYVQDLSKDQIVACYACSDGIEDSLEDLEALNAFFCNITGVYAQDGGPVLENSLQEFLPQMSQAGSADDMSIAGIVDAEGAAAHARELELRYLLQNAQAEYHRANAKVSSMQRKDEYLESAVEAAQAKYEQLSARQRSIKSKLDQLLQEVLTANQMQDEGVGLVENAQKELEEARKAYEEYHTRRNAFAEKARQAQQKIQQMKDQLQALQAQIAQPPQPEEPEIPTEEPEVPTEEPEVPVEAQAQPEPEAMPAPAQPEEATEPEITTREA